MADLKKPQSKSRISRAIESVFSSKGRNNTNGAYIQTKVEELEKIKKFIRKDFLLCKDNFQFDLDKLKKPKKKDHFTAITSFVTIDARKNKNCNLFSSNTLPVQSLKTPVSVINRLTKKIYEVPKNVPFPLKLPIKSLKKLHRQPSNPFPLVQIHVTEPILIHETFDGQTRAKTTEIAYRKTIVDEQVTSFDIGGTINSSMPLSNLYKVGNPPEEVCMKISDSCNRLLRLNKKNKRLLLKKSKSLKRGLTSCKNYTTMISQSNKRATYYLLHQQFLDAHKTNTYIN